MKKNFSKEGKRAIGWLLLVAMIYAGCSISPETAQMITDATAGAAGKAADSALPGTGTAAAIVTGYAAGRILEWLGVKGYGKLAKKEG